MFGIKLTEQMLRANDALLLFHLVKLSHIPNVCRNTLYVSFYNFMRQTLNADLFVELKRQSEQVAFLTSTCLYPTVTFNSHSNGRMRV